MMTNVRFRIGYTSKFDNVNTKELLLLKITFSAVNAVDAKFQVT
jgi:hypothetical protein